MSSRTLRVCCIALFGLWAGCAPGAAPSVTRIPGGIAIAHGNYIDYLFGAGATSDAVHYHAEGASGSCDGKVKFDDVYVEFTVDAKTGKIVEDTVQEATLSGKPLPGSTCNGQPAPSEPLTETYKIDSAKLLNGKVEYFTASAPKHVTGSMVASGHVCDIIIDTEYYHFDNGSEYLHIDGATIRHVEESLPKPCPGVAPKTSALR